MVIIVDFDIWESSNVDTGSVCIFWFLFWDIRFWFLFRVLLIIDFIDIFFCLFLLSFEGDSVVE